MKGLRMMPPRTLVAIPLVVVMLTVVPTSAETIATGSITLVTGNNAYSTPEVYAFVAGGCAGNHSDAVMQAVIDVRQYQGGKILVSDNGVDLGPGGLRLLNYAFLDRCEHQPVLTRGLEPVFPGTPLEIDVTGEYLVVNAGGAPTNTGVKFKVEAP